MKCKGWAAVYTARFTAGGPVNSMLINTILHIPEKPKIYGVVWDLRRGEIFNRVCMCLYNSDIQWLPAKTATCGHNTMGEIAQKIARGNATPWRIHVLHHYCNYCFFIPFTLALQATLPCPARGHKNLSALSLRIPVHYLFSCMRAPTIHSHTHVDISALSNPIYMTRIIQYNSSLSECK